MWKTYIHKYSSQQAVTPTIFPSLHFFFFFTLICKCILETFFFNLYLYVDTKPVCVHSHSDTVLFLQHKFAVLNKEAFELQKLQYEKLVRKKKSPLALNQFVMCTMLLLLFFCCFFDTIGLLIGEAGTINMGWKMKVCVGVSYPAVWQSGLGNWGHWWPISPLLQKMGVYYTVCLSPLQWKLHSPWFTSDFPCFTPYFVNKRSCRGQSYVLRLFVLVIEPDHSRTKLSKPDLITLWPFQFQAKVCILNVALICLESSLTGQRVNAMFEHHSTALFLLSALITGHHIWYKGWD